MRKYKVNVPILYNKYPYVKENPKMTEKLILGIDKELNLLVSEKSIIGEKVEKKEKDVIHITMISSGEKFYINLDGILAENDDEALEIVRDILFRLCQDISYLAQKEIGYADRFHIYFFWRDRDIEMTSFKCDNCSDYQEIEKDDGRIVVKLNDYIGVSDSTEGTIYNWVNTEMIENIEYLAKENETFSFMLKAYYAALGDNDFASKYYRLFTIIEYLEQNFVNKIEFDKLVPCNVAKKSLESVMNIVGDWLNKSGNNENRRKDISDRINSRLSNILKTATLESRDEKLLFFLAQRYGISRIKGINDDSELNVSKIHKFTKLRNTLFHGKEYGKQDLQDITNELMLLCQQIMQIELEKSEENKGNKPL